MPTFHFKVPGWPQDVVLLLILTLLMWTLGGNCDSTSNLFLPSLWETLVGLQPETVVVIGV